MKNKLNIKPDWKWAAPEGSRQFDRMLDHSLTFRERLEWLEAAETLSLRLAGARFKKPKRAAHMAA